MAKKTVPRTGEKPLLDIEPRLRRVRGHRQLPKLEAALRRARRIKEQQRHMADAA